MFLGYIDGYEGGYWRLAVYSFLPLLILVLYVIPLIGCISTSLWPVYFLEFQNQNNSSSQTIDIRMGYLGTCVSQSQCFRTVNRSLKSIISEASSSPTNATNQSTTQALTEINTLQSKAVLPLVLLAMAGILFLSGFITFWVFSFYTKPPPDRKKQDTENLSEAEKLKQQRHRQVADQFERINRRKHQRRARKVTIIFNCASVGLLFSSAASISTTVVAIQSLNSPVGSQFIVSGGSLQGIQWAHFILSVTFSLAIEVISRASYARGKLGDLEVGEEPGSTKKQSSTGSKGGQKAPPPPPPPPPPPA